MLLLFRHAPILESFPRNQYRSLEILSLERVDSMTKSLCAVLLALGLVFPMSLRAEEVVEKAGTGIGLTIGNVIAVPAKAISVSIGMAAGLLSFVLTGGDTEVAGQTWRNSIEDPYLITPEVAQKAIGERPQLKEKDIQTSPY
jgi:hypothetical protein